MSAHVTLNKAPARMQHQQDVYLVRESPRAFFSFRYINIFEDFHDLRDHSSVII